METEMNPIFISYRDYVAQCLESNTEVPTLTEFTGSAESFKIEEVEDVPAAQ
jgi:hypothetical protein